MTPLITRDLAPRLARIPGDLTPELFHVLSSISERLFDATKHPGRRCLLFTACDPRCGVSFFCSSLALALAAHSGGVLLLNGSLGKELIMGKRDVKESQLRQLSREPVWTLQRGTCPEPGANLFGTGELTWRDLRDRFRHILVDGPSLSENGVSLSLANRVDGVVLLAVTGQTTVRSLRQARQRFTKAGGSVVGAVMNDSFAKPEEAL